MSRVIPEWAIERASELRDAETRGQATATSSYLALARYIAEHEDPPVDPLEEAVAAAAKTVWPLAIGRFHKDVRRKFISELRKRGIELAKTGEA